MLSTDDKALLEKKGISESQWAKQMECFKNGFPYLKLKGAASLENGIMKPDENKRDAYVCKWQNYVNEGKEVTKFVPASGAASRMFKNLFEFLTASYNEPQTDFEKTFFTEIANFAFYEALNSVCERNEGKTIAQLVGEGNYKAVVSNLLESKGLNYGQLPKGLLLFHRYANTVRTPLEEHLVEAALYAAAQGKTKVHFTVSSEHRALFQTLIDEVLPAYKAQYGVEFEVSLSEQKQSTDTVAATMDNEPFRVDGKMLFRPGGHGALIQNLNDLDSDVVFIKNIDNVVPDKFKEDTVLYKKVIGGILVDLQSRIFEYLRLLDGGVYTHAQLEDMIRFVQQELYCRKEDIKDMEDSELVVYLNQKLNRPIRVCGVVPNVGEPGGGPFLAVNPDGTVSLQILESSQIDSNNPDYVKMFQQGTHFNPVDLVCGIKDYKGKAFNLPDFVDANTGFISYKSKNGKDLKALELPGLWNGAMSNWNTVFVEVPISTFNPVKTVNDLLRVQHQ